MTAPGLHRNVWILTAAQAFMMSLNSLNVFVGGIVGKNLAPSEKLSTLPVASMVIGTALASVPVTLIMRRFGRKSTFLGVAIYSILVALLAAYAISIGHFILFCFSGVLFGFSSACMMQYRFASMESVEADQVPKAASFVLIGGILAAFIGPEIALAGRNLTSVDFSGSYLLLSGLFLVGLVILMFFRDIEMREVETNDSKRPLRVIMRQPVFWTALIGATVGYAVMTFIMTATPVSMHVMDGHSLSDTKWVIQSHIVAMFLPSIITGWLIKRLGIARMMIAGLIVYLLCIAIAFSGHLLHHYWVSLVLLGLGWNFLFVGGTALLPQSYLPSERFKVQAVNEFVVFGVQAVASLSAGWMVFALGWERMLLFTVPVILLQFGVIWYWLRSIAPVGKTPSASL